MWGSGYHAKAGLHLSYPSRHENSIQHTPSEEFQLGIMPKCLRIHGKYYSKGTWLQASRNIGMRFMASENLPCCNEAKDQPDIYQAVPQSLWKMVVLFVCNKSFKKCAIKCNQSTCDHPKECTDIESAIGWSSHALERHVWYTSSACSKRFRRPRSYYIAVYCMDVLNPINLRSLQISFLVPHA